jgi:hypothetical protein
MGKLKQIKTNQKSVDVVLVPFENVGWKTTSGSNLTFTAVQRDPDNGRPFSNLYTSFKLPLTTGQSNTYNSTWVDSGISGLNQSNVIVVSIADNQYGELIDGRTIRFNVPTITTNGSAFKDTILYSSYYEPKPFSSDNSEKASYFGARKIEGNPVGAPQLASTNISFLFSDDTKVPTLAASNTNISNWSDGWQTGVVPNGYDGGNVDTFRFTDTISVSNTPKAYAQTADVPVGICYLDKGFMVITDPTIISNFNYSAGTQDGTIGYGGASSGFTNLHYTASTSATSQYYTFEKEWVLSVNIVADSGEFYITENQSAADGSRPYYGAGGKDTGMEFKTPFGDVNKIWDISDISSTFITEVGLYDAQNRLLAVAKPDRPIEKPKNTPVTLTLKMKF